MDEAWSAGQESFQQYLERIKGMFTEKAAAAARAAAGTERPAGGASEPETQDPDAQEPAESRIIRTKAAETPRHVTKERWREMERAAARHRTPPEALGGSMEVLFFAISGLYAAYKAGNISRDEATRTKAEIIAWCDEMHEKDDGAARMGEFFKNVEEATRAYALAPSLETADGIYQACYKTLPRKRMQAGQGDAGEKNVIP